MNMDEYSKDIDIFVFKRPWNKLREIHKIMKIKEFVDEIIYKKVVKEVDIKKNKEYLKIELCKGVKEKKYTKNKNEIAYDMESMKIISIGCLILNKKKGLYNIVWD